MSVNDHISLTANELCEAIVNHLAERDAANEFASVLLEHVLAQPIANVINLDHAIEVIEPIATSEATAQIMADYLGPAIALEISRTEDSGEQLGEYLPEHVVAGFIDRLGRPIELPTGWAEGIVDPVLVRELVADVLADAIEVFLARVPMAGNAGGLIAGLTRGVSRFKPSGTMGLLTNQVKSFAAQSADRVRKHVEERLTAPENEQAMQGMRERAVHKILELATVDALRMLDDPGIEQISQWVMSTAVHNLSRPEIRTSIEAQMSQALAFANQQTIGEWLEVVGASDVVRRRLLSSTTDMCQSLVQEAAFSDWLIRTIKTVAK